MQLPDEILRPEDILKPGEQPEPPEAQPASDPPQEEPEGEPEGEEPEGEEGGPIEGDEPPVQDEPEPSVEGGEEPPAPQSDYLQDLSQITGLELKSINDVVDVLSEASRLKKDPYQALGISNQIKAAIEAEKQGIPPSKFFSVTSMNPENMNKKELLRQHFMLSNPEDSEQDPEFMQMKFEKDYDAKYSILDDKRTEEDFDNEAEWRNFQREKLFAEKMLASEASKAKSGIATWKEKALQPEKSGPSQEEIDAMVKTYQLETKRVMSGLKHLTVKIGDNPYNIAMKPDELQFVQKSLEDPMSFLKEIGITNDKVDQQKFAQFVSLFALRDTLPEKIATHKIEMKNKKVVTNKLENGKTTTTRVPANMNEFSDELAEAAHLLAQKEGRARNN